jgi:hypothetical protein
VWSRAFLKALAGKRKVAIRLGELQEHESAYRLKRKAVNALCRGEKHIEDLTGFWCQSGLLPTDIGRL